MSHDILWVIKPTILGVSPMGPWHLQRVQQWPVSRVHPEMPWTHLTIQMEFLSIPPQHRVRSYDLRSWDCLSYCVCCHCLPQGVCSPLFFPFLLFCLLYPIVTNKNFCLTAALFTFVMFPFMLCFGIILRWDIAEVLASGPSLALPTFWWGVWGGFQSSASPFSFVLAHQQQPPCPSASWPPLVSSVRALWA